eukprot:138769-Rhodomonas_salina.1
MAPPRTGRRARREVQLPKQEACRLFAQAPFLHQVRTHLRPKRRRTTCERSDMPSTCVLEELGRERGAERGGSGRGEGGKPLLLAGLYDT